MPAPQPMPMAVMRNAHEVIRGAVQDIQKLLDQGELKEATKLFQDYKRFQDLHMYMEEGNATAKGLFFMMDEHAEKAASNAKLSDQHTDLTDLEQQVQKAMVDEPDLELARELFPKFAAENEAHLKKEEDIMMPIVQKLVQTGHPVKKYIIDYLMPVLWTDPKDIEFFVKFANQILERHDGPTPKVRVMDQALWAIASPDQWKLWKVWIEESLTTEKFDTVMGEIQAFIEEQKAMKQQQEPPKKQPRWMRLMRNPVEC